MATTSVRQQIDNLLHNNKLDIKAAKEFQANRSRIDAFWNKRMLSPEASLQYHIDGRPLMRVRKEEAISKQSSGINVQPITFSWEDKGSAVAYCHMILISGIDNIPFSFEVLGDEASSKREENTFFTDDTLSPYSVETIYNTAYAITHAYVDRDNNDSPFQNTAKGPLWFAEIKHFELHPSYRGMGVGSNLLHQALNEVRRKTNIGFFVLDPFPMQYQIGSGQPLFEDDTSNHMQYVLDSAKLRQHYMNAYGAESFVADEPEFGVPLMFKGSTDLQIAKREDFRRWKFVHFDKD